MGNRTLSLAGILAAWVVVLCSCSGPSVPVSAVSEWALVVADDAIPSERYAAEEFRDLWKQGTGVELPIRAAAEHPEGNIFIGPSESMRASDVAIDISGFGEEELAIRIGRRNIAIAGGRPRGTLYGVYTFFERYLGVRFLTADHTYFPRDIPRRRLPVETFRYKPVFLYRNVYFGEVQTNPRFATRLRVNTVTDSAKYGGKTAQQLINHSFYRQVPVEKYGREHPEYFALVDGERKLQMWGGGPQLDVSNPEVVEVVAEAVLREIEEHPEWRNYSVSQNDNDQYCHCDSCQAINRREGTPMGAHLRFVNAVAAKVAEKYPDKKIGTLAYWYTRKPPRHIRPAKNVQIQLADIECCRLHPIDDPDCPRNRAFREDLEGWSKIAHELYIWTYATDFRYYDLPIPNLKSIGPNLKFYARHGVKGVFEQGNARTLSGEMSDLRNYVIARCLWNPKLDSWEVAREFCRLHYGKAAPIIWEYLNFEHDWVEEHGDHPTCFANPKALGLNREFALRASDYFRRALEAAENDTIRQRVEKVSLTAYRTMMEAGAEFVYEDGRLRRSYPPGFENVVEEYIALAKKVGLSAADERTPFPRFEERLRQQYLSGIPALKIENEFWKLIAIPSMNGKIVVMEHKPDGRQLLPMLRTNFDYGAWDEVPFDVVDLTRFNPAYEGKVVDSTLVLEWRVPGKTLVRREIGFDPADPRAIVCTTTVTHLGRVPREYQFVVHPEFWAGTSSGDWRVLSAYVYKGGQWLRYNDSLRAAQGPKAHLLLEAVEGGRHAFFNHEAGFGVLETYDPAEYERLRTWWIPEEELINLELLTKRVRLSAGESFRYRYEFQYLRQWPPETVGSGS